MPAKSSTKPKTSAKPSMDDLLAKVEVLQLQHGDLIEGEIISVQKHEVCLDIGHYGIGVVPRRELTSTTSLEVGEKLSVSVISPETVGGYAVLSLRRALRSRGWDEIQRIFDSSEMLEVDPYDANRGGLLIEFEGVRGFLPLSQLSVEHYPRATSADRDEILHKLNKLVGKKLKVCVLDLDRSANKVIFSEKEALKEIIARQLEALNIGDILEGVVTTVIEFGAFVSVNDIEGLVHISELSWERIEDPRNYVKVGEKVKVKVVAIDKGRLALSIRQLTPDPWQKEAENLKVGDIVNGKVTRVTVFGAFVQISPVIEALANVGDINNSSSDKRAGKNGKKEDSSAGGVKPEDIFKVGQSYDFKILDINREGRKVALRLKSSAGDDKKTKKATTDDAKAAPEKEEAVADGSDD